MLFEPFLSEDIPEKAWLLLQAKLNNLVIEAMRDGNNLKKAFSQDKQPVR